MVNFVPSMVQRFILEVDPTISPKKIRGYDVPRAHEDVFKTELDRLVRIGVLEPADRSEWISGTFIIPKKDGTVRWVSDFRALNKALRRRCYPMPRIADILTRRKGYKFLSKLDISMQYYTFDLDDESKELTTIATPFGLYRYRKLPMGINCAPDIAQEAMENLFRAVKDIEIYIDDIAAFSDTWPIIFNFSIRSLPSSKRPVLQSTLSNANLVFKKPTFLAIGSRPKAFVHGARKIDAILKMQAPTNIKELRSFLGLVNYYRDMWPKRSHILAPLTEMTGKKTVSIGPRNVKMPSST